MRNEALEQGDIAELWETSRSQSWPKLRIKTSLRSVVGGVWGAEPEDDTGIVCVRVADFDRVRLCVDDSPPTKRSYSESELNGRQLVKNDLLIEKSGGGSNQPVGCVVRFDGDYEAVCSNFIARLELRSEHDARFWAYLHAAIYSARLNTLAIKQTTGIQNLDLDQYLGFRVVAPPYELQLAIADYLDRETAKIDTMIAAKERLLKLLAEKRRALITDAVTRGLNPDAPMRDSGVEWLGEIPEHWSVDRFKFHMLGIEQGWSPQCLNVPAELDEWGVLKAGCVNGPEFDTSQNKTLPPSLDPIVELEVKPGDLLMSRSNTTKLLGSTALVREVRPKLLICDKLYRIEVNEETAHKPFLVYLLRSAPGRHEFERDATGASNSMQNIGQDSVKNVWLVFPPFDEQVAICRYLDQTLQRIDALRSNNLQTVTLLKERRAALIAAAVSGAQKVEAAT
ncbi:restriction endonuclease subunit S [Adhaeretor mobilis]|uniref:Type-1 restriction enzyme EcoKI specificity protein n=1 Tax=Adhaeretor mobilis TaxID=1930276 RepID=A0A517MWQ3_9BACT|nr:restriction endonuclease subunit S [Adhaeretor mobilis]QDS99310.1 Type-1 restriction enzyme EcoKI specificity protein [Adhaeretor mobilis]